MGKRFFIVFTLLAVIYPGFVFGASRYFIETTPLPEARQMYGTAVLGDHLYVIGGYRIGEGLTDNVKMANILPDGRLGIWVDTTPLPENRCYISNSTLALNDRLYVVGGFNGRSNENKKTVLWTYPGPDGQLAPWRESIPFPGEGLSCLTAVATPGYIHILGGYTQSDQPSATVHSGRLGADGSIIEWMKCPALPELLWFHHAAVMGGRVWVWGGLTTPKNTDTSADVFSAPILGSGLIGEWRKEATSLPKPFYRGACTAGGAFLLTFCVSYSGGEISSDAYFANLTQNGLSKWGYLDTGLPVKNYLGVAPDFRRNNIYIPGGRISMANVSDLDSRVFFFHLQTKGGAQPTPSPKVRATPTPQVPRYTFVQEMRPPAGALPGFLSYEQGRNIMRLKNLPLVCYFHTPLGKRCRKQVANLSASAGLSGLLKQAVFAWVDISASPQLAQQFGVFRAPAWLFFHSDGTGAMRTDDVLTFPQIMQSVKTLH